MAKCALHPGRPPAAAILGKDYCRQCQLGILEARGWVHKHVQPKDCFVWYEGNDSWLPIDGTGCAHWVAHQMNIRAGGKGEQCLAGLTFRVKTLVSGRPRCSSPSLVRVNYIWASPAMDHVGIVVKVADPPKPGDPPKITIRHDSSAQGRVADNDFATYFKGRGIFFR